MKALLKMDGSKEMGGSAVLMHNERLANPLDPFAEAVSQPGAARSLTKRRRSDARHLHLILGQPRFVRANAAMVPAPIRRDQKMAAAPIAPAPITATRAPLSGASFLTPRNPDASGSTSAPSSNDSDAGKTIALRPSINV
jgi:hypothetical protein